MRQLNLMAAQDAFDNLPNDATGHRCYTPARSLRTDTPLNVIVHPGSLMGSYDMYWREDAPADDRILAPERLRANVATMIARDPSNTCVILGDFCDEIVPPDDQGLQDAINQVYRNGTILMATPHPDALTNAAMAANRLCYAADRPSVQVAGAWADAETGCAAHVATALEDAGAAVTISPNTACFNPDDAWFPETRPPALGPTLPC